MASVVINTRFNISIHAPAGGATGDHDKTRLGQDHFNSRPCGRGDAQQSQPTAPKPISIHAPAGGATDLTPFEPIVKLISIHAPAGGATVGSFLQSLGRGISIHAPAGGATLGGIVDSIMQGISIHAPAGGATLGLLQLRERLLISIHAPAGGATACWYVELLADTLFQFTPLREGRRPRSTRSWSKC